MTRILHISDTHLSRARPFFAENWPPLRDWIEAQKADLVIHGGDVTLDGAGAEEDMAYCSSVFGALSAPVLSVPGNHDVGVPGNPHQPVDGERLERWRRHFGPDAWTRDIDGWRLLGFNSMILSSGLVDEESQFSWLEQAMAEAGGRRIAWFLHQPLFVRDPAETDGGYWSVQPQPRARLLDMIGRFGVALVSSGHLHRRHDRVHEGVRHVWVPSTAFAVGEALQPPPFPGEPVLGVVTYQFGGGEVSVGHESVGGLTHMWIDDIVHEVYPTPTPDEGG